MEPYVKLANQPLVLALAEIRFSPIMGIDKYIAELQDRLRDKYPLFQKGEVNSVNLSGNTIEVQQKVHWSFISKDRLQAVNVCSDRLFLCTSKYNRYPDFERDSLHLLNIFNEVVRPSLVNRIGFRYSNCIKEQEGYSLRELVDQQYLYSTELGRDEPVRHHREETVRETEHGVLCIRSSESHSRAVLPDDAKTLPVLTKEDSEGSVRLILDIDHYWQSDEEPMDFNIDDILDKISCLHESSRAVFWSMTTPAAKEKVWR